MEVIKCTNFSKVFEALSKHEEVVVMSKADYNGLMETLYLKSVPGMEESIVSAMNAPKSEFVKFGWDA